MYNSCYYWLIANKCKSPRPYKEEFIRILFLLYQANAVISTFKVILSNLSYPFSNSIKLCKNPIKVYSKCIQKNFSMKWMHLKCIQSETTEIIVNIWLVWYTIWEKQFLICSEDCNLANKLNEKNILFRRSYNGIWRYY